METAMKIRSSTCNIHTSFENLSSASFSIVQMCQSSDNDYVGIPSSPPNDINSENSVKTTVHASLSDNCGILFYDNSSKSIGGSYRINIYKQRKNIIENKCNVSQFDSLYNRLEKNMSIENFNTLQKGSIAPIDPPLEFQDSPNNKNQHDAMQTLNRFSSSHSSLENEKGMELCVKNMDRIFMERTLVATKYFENTNKDICFLRKPIYSSDSFLSSNLENLYDEPNNVMGGYTFGTNQISESQTSSFSLCFPPTSGPTGMVKKSVCSFYHDNTKYFKAIPSEQDCEMSATRKFHTIHDNDLYNGIKRNLLQCENSLQNKVLYSPRRVQNFCHSTHHPINAGPNGCANRPNSRNSFNSRLSSSHNSLSTSSTNKPDDSIFITQAMSHDALLTREITDFYNVPIDSDIYALPIDMVKSDCSNIAYKGDKVKDFTKINLSNIDNCKELRLGQKNHRNKRKTRNSDTYENDTKSYSYKMNSNKFKSNGKTTYISSPKREYRGKNAEQTLPDLQPSEEKLPTTLGEVRRYYQTFYSGTKTELIGNSESGKGNLLKKSHETFWNEPSPHSRGNTTSKRSSISSNYKVRTKTFKAHNERNDKINNNINNLDFGNNCNTSQNHIIKVDDTCSQVLRNEKKHFTLSLKQKFFNIFRIRRTQRHCERNPSSIVTPTHHGAQRETNDKQTRFQSRALPPLPNRTDSYMEQSRANPKQKEEPRSQQFTSSIEKVKNYGWYWGPLSSEAAEKVLSSESDGSFIVRDSSDDHYIFSLSFKLNNCVRHVRIEQDQGTFSFGSYAKFKSQTITEFIEKAVEHSRSGRYLFFLHRRPEHGPMRVQLTNPVSRFKHVQSLQHMCRFVILKTVIRKDLIQSLPLPRRLLDYLNYRQYFSEQIDSESSPTQVNQKQAYSKKLY